MNDVEGSSDESIGRPGPWREGRYQQSGKVPASVTPPSGNSAMETDAVDNIKGQSVPVTQEDYGNSRLTGARNSMPDLDE